MWARFRQLQDIHHTLLPPIEHVPGERQYGSHFGVSVQWDGRFGMENDAPSLDAFHQSDLLAVFIVGDYRGWETRGVRKYVVEGLVLALESEGESFTRVGTFKHEERERLLRLITDRFDLRPTRMTAETEGLRLGFGLGKDS